MARLVSITLFGWLSLTAAIGAAAEYPSVKDIAEIDRRLTRLREESRWPEAMPLAEKLFGMMSARYGLNNTNTVEALHWWAWLTQNNGDFDKAEELWLQALKIDEALFGKGSLQTTRRLHLLANLYKDRAEYEKAAPLLRRALAIREKAIGPSHSDTGQVVRSLGFLNILMGNHAAAESNLVRALHIFQETADDDGALGGTMSGLAWLYMEIGDRDQAERMIRDSLKIIKQFYGGTHDYTAGSLRQCSVLYRAKGELEKAESLLRDALGIQEKRLGTNHIALSQTLNDLGWTLLEKGNLDAASESFQRSQRIVESVLGSEDFRVSLPLMGLSRLQESRGNYQSARDLCEHAYRIRKKHFGDSHESTVANLRELARLEAALGHSDWALAQADQIQQAEEASLANLLSFTSSRQRLDLRSQSDRFRQRHELWADLNAVEPLARGILRTKGLALDSSLEDRRLAESSDNPSVRELVNKIKEQQRSLARLETTTNNPDIIRARVDLLEADLARKVAGLGRARRSLSVNVEQVQAALPPNSVLLEMLRYRHYQGKARWQQSYGALVIRPHERLQWIPLGPAEAIERNIKLYQHALRSNGASQLITDSLNELYCQLWRPLLPAVPPETREIIISPDGELNFVSFATLMTPAGSLLGEDHLFSYVSCARDLLAQPKPVCDQSLIILANPTFDARREEFRESSSLPIWHFAPLPSAEREGRNLCSRAREFGFTNAVLRLGPDASEAELFQVRSPKVLHLATHGFVLPPRVASFNAEDDEFGSVSPQFARRDPMLQSGIVLAGAQRSFQLWADGKAAPAENDGIVSAAEIGALNLRGTWLVVLAACDTAIGEARAGEGVLGLRRGFLQAGAQNLLLTLWPVDDESTGTFIADFYSALKSNPPPIALAKVQQGWLRKLRTEKGPAEASRLAGPFILSFQGTLRTNDVFAPQ